MLTAKFLKMHYCLTITSKTEGVGKKVRCIVVIAQTYTVATISEIVKSGC